MSHRSHLNSSCLLALVALLLAPRLALAWGANGHRISSQVAESRLSQEARDALAGIAGARTLAMLSTWPDFARSDPAWKLAAPWHYLSVEDDETLEAVLAAAASTPEPDNVVEAIHYFRAILAGDADRRRHFEALMEKHGAAPREGSVELTALSFLVHFVTDLHQPLHVGRGDDRGGGAVAVEFFGEVEKLHTVWDTGIIERQRLSYTEFAAFLENELAGRLEAGDGGPEEWARESRGHRARLYRIWERTSRESHLPELGYLYVYDHLPTVQRRLFLGGLRLAALLNSIYE